MKPKATSRETCPSVAIIRGRTTGEPGPFGWPNNNVNGRAEGQEVQPDSPVLRKALFRERRPLWKKKQ